MGNYLHAKTDLYKAIHGMQEQMGTGNLIICIMLIVWVSVQLLLLWIKALFNNRPLTMAEYVFKIARVTGKSEYDVFFKSAEEWPITKEKIEEDFKAYLVDQSVPYYVMDFVRKNKAQIDELHVPRY